MDEELKHLETELKRMRPAALPQDLVRRIERELAQPVAPRVPGPVHWIWAVVVPAAAALAVWIAPPRAQDSSTLAAPNENLAATGLKPVSAENLLVTAEDEGLVTLHDGTTARRARLSYVDTITWRNPRTNASLTWTVPREEVRVVPVIFQ